MTKSIKSLIAASLCLAASVLASGQNGGLIHFGMDLNPATESAQMIRYGNNVPSLYTGAMEYSIPVYTYSDPDFTIPISLDYHFDGFRPAQASGTVGYGWNLGCGGIITREIYGLPDEEGYFGATGPQGAIHEWKSGPMLSNSVVSSNVGTVGSGDWSTLFKSIPVISTTEDLNEHVWLNGRYGFGDEDEILYNLFTTPCVDRSCIRGKLSQEIWYDSEGEISREVDYTYSFYTISEQMRLVNMVNCLTYQDFSIDYPELTSVTMIDHGLSTSSSYSYDALGRKVGEEINNGLFGSHISRTFTYDSKFKGSIASQAEVKTRSHVLDSDESTMTYTYDHSGKNRIPVSIVETHGGTSRTTTIQCNTKYRPVRINYPGRRWTQYMWNSEGSQLLGNTTNAAGNTTSYTWKDIARLKSVTMPTGLSESYDYDSHSRMSGRRDSDGRLIQSYEYHLLNE